MPQPLHALGCFTADIATYVLQPVGWLARPASVPCIGLTLDLIIPFIQLLRGSSLSPGVRESSSKAQRWDQGTSANPSLESAVALSMYIKLSLFGASNSKLDFSSLDNGARCLLTLSPWVNGNATSLSMTKPQLFPHKDG